MREILQYWGKFWLGSWQKAHFFPSGDVIWFNFEGIAATKQSKINFCGDIKRRKLERKTGKDKKYKHIQNTYNFADVFLKSLYCNFYIVGIIIIDIIGKNKTKPKQNKGKVILISCWTSRQMHFVWHCGCLLYIQHSLHEYEYPVVSPDTPNEGVVYTAKNNNLKTIGQKMNNKSGVWLTAASSYDWQVTVRFLVQWGPVSLKSEHGVFCKLHFSFTVTTPGVSGTNFC